MRRWISTAESRAYDRNPGATIGVRRKEIAMARAELARARVP